MTTVFETPCNCNGREIWKNQGMPGRPPNPVPVTDEDGYPHCVFCGLIKLYPMPNGNTTLTQCPSCSRWFKGYRRYPKFHLECPECE